MRSFATIATFASLAFAAVCSALPTGSSPYGAVVPHGHKYDVAVRNEITDAVGTIVDTQSLGHQTPRGDDHVKSVLDIIVDVTAEVRPICDKLTAALTAEIEVEVAVKLSLELLAEIKVILVKAVADIKACIAVGVDLLLLNGVACTLDVIAKIVAELLIIVLAVIQLVLKVCAAVDVSVILKLVLEIVAQLACIVSLVLSIVAGLLAVLIPLLGEVIAICHKLNLLELLKVLAVVKA